MKKVAIVVVTYNRIQMLKEVIDALRVQTFANRDIIIVNNGSTDGTLEWLQLQDDIITITQENCGGAGGFYTGMKFASENNYDYCWVMDDDVIAYPDALEKLLYAHRCKGNLGFVCSRVLGVDGQAMNTPTVDNRSKDDCYPDYCDMIGYNMIKVSSATFVSVLVLCSKIKEVGLPYKDFFIWGDDTEYTLRLSLNHDCYMVCDSLVVHKRAIQKQLTIEGENDKRRIKNYFYNIRNCGYYTHKYGGIQDKIIYHLWIWKLILGNLNFPYKALTVLRGYLSFFTFNPKLEFPTK